VSLLVSTNHRHSHCHLRTRYDRIFANICNLICNGEARGVAIIIFGGRTLKILIPTCRDRQCLCHTTALIKGLGDYLRGI
jgi:hypothetical protein